MPDQSMRILESMMDVAAFRHKVLTSNIANADTPGYKAKDISFQDAMNNAISNDGKSQYNIYEAGTTMSERDGNTVNIDIEMAKVAENTLLYDTAAQLMAMKLRMRKAVLTSP
ncbi:MAG: flagellar basal body rod protein FlgB [Nitrospirae bacterium]|nr:flagellar basal body rod protein FlgB [Nitrospirota bacterium]